MYADCVFPGIDLITGETENVVETGNETAILQMNARTVVSVLAIYSREQKV